MPGKTDSISVKKLNGTREQIQKTLILCNLSVICQICNSTLMKNMRNMLPDKLRCSNEPAWRLWVAHRLPVLKGEKEASSTPENRITMKGKGNISPSHYEATKRHRPRGWILGKKGKEKVIRKLGTSTRAWKRKKLFLYFSPYGEELD